MGKLCDNCGDWINFATRNGVTTPINPGGGRHHCRGRAAVVASTLTRQIRQDDAPRGMKRAALEVAVPSTAEWGWLLWWMLAIVIAVELAKAAWQWLIG